MIFSDNPILDAERYFAKTGEGRDSSSEPPEVLDRISDRVLAYRPKPKTKAAKRRARREARRQRNQ